MEISSIISLRWGQLLGYSTGAALGFQSVKSLFHGAKDIISAFNGSETYKERIQRAATDQLNIFSNIKNFVVGSDTFSKRFTHFTNGLENLSISVIAGLFSYLLFFKVFETSINQNTSPLPDRTNLEEMHNENLSQCKAASIAYKEQNCYIHNFFDATSKLALSTCAQLGYFQDEYYLSYNLTEISTSKIFEILQCLKEFSLFKKMEVIIQKPTIQHRLLEKAQERIVHAIAEIKNNSMQTDLININSNTNLSLLNSEQSTQELKPLFDEYLNGFYKLFQEVLDNYSEYVDGHKKRLDHHVLTSMTLSWGPFDIHLNQICDKKLFEKLPVTSHLDQEHCKKYNALKNALELAQDQGETIQELIPNFSNTNCKSEVFDKLFDEADQLELKLPLNLYHAFKTLQKELKNRLLHK